MFRLSIAIALASFATGCVYPPGGPHDLSYVRPTQIADYYNELIETQRADYRTSDLCAAALIIASAHPTADLLGDAATRKAAAIADLRRGIEASAGNADAERACADNMVELFNGSSVYPGRSLFDPSPTMLTCLRTTEESPRFATAAELDTCLAANY